MSGGVTPYTYSVEVIDGGASGCDIVIGSSTGVISGKVTDSTNRGLRFTVTDANGAIVYKTTSVMPYNWGMTNYSSVTQSTALIEGVAGSATLRASFDNVPDGLPIGAKWYTAGNMESATDAPTGVSIGAKSTGVYSGSSLIEDITYNTTATTHAGEYFAATTAGEGGRFVATTGTGATKANKLVVSRVKELGSQDGALTAGTNYTVLYTLITANLVTGFNFGVKWYTDSNYDTERESPPTGVTASVTLSEGKFQLVVGTDASADTYYFAVTYGPAAARVVTPARGTLVIGTL